MTVSELDTGQTIPGVDLGGIKLYDVKTVSNVIGTVIVSLDGYKEVAVW